MSNGERKERFDMTGFEKLMTEDNSLLHIPVLLSEMGPLSVQEIAYTLERQVSWVTEGVNKLVGAQVVQLKEDKYVISDELVPMFDVASVFIFKGIKRDEITRMEGAAATLLERANKMFSSLQLDKQAKEVFSGEKYSTTQYAITEYEVSSEREGGGPLLGVVAAITQVFGEDESGPAIIISANPYTGIIEVIGGNFKESLLIDDLAIENKFKQLLLVAKHNPGSILHVRNPDRDPVIRCHYFSLLINEAPRIGRNS